MSRIRNERDQLLAAANRLLERAHDAKAVPLLPGVPSDYVSSVHMTTELLDSIKFPDLDQHKLDLAVRDEFNSRLAGEIEALNAKLTEATAAADKEKTTATDTRPVVGYDVATGASVVQRGARIAILDESVPRVHPHYFITRPRQAGKAPHLHLDMSAQPRKSETEIRNEVLTKVIEALQLEAYGFHDPTETVSQASALFFGRFGHPEPDPEGFWADIQTTLADREEDRELDRVEAARARIEGLTAPAKSGDEPESADFDLAGETLADAA